MSNEHVNEHRSAWPWVSNGGVHEHQVVEGGITKREYYAAMAMQGMLANSEITYCVNIEHIKFISRDAFLIADAMIKDSENATC